ncbi:MAG TPA: cytochrome c [Burkholderiales bacterium]|nr:cytochrome c [Burkholderiales bacterium]
MNKAAIVLAAALCLPLAALAGGNPAAGQQKAAQVCAACHGAHGNKPSAPDQPILAGQYPDYLVQVLGDYKSGKRKNAIMNGMAAGLSKQDMEDLAAWFSSQSSPLYTER